MVAALPAHRIMRSTPDPTVILGVESVRNVNVTILSGTASKSGRCQRFREINMTNAPRTRAPKFEAEITGSDIFKIVATIIALLVVGAMGALYLGIMS